MADKPLVHPLSRSQFYAECLRHATTGAWGWIGNVSTVMALALPLVKSLWPKAYAQAAALLASMRLGEELLWIFPMSAGALILVARFLTAGFLIYSNKPAGVASVAPPKPKVKLQAHRYQVKVETSHLSPILQRVVKGTFYTTAIRGHNFGEADAVNVRAVIAIPHTDYTMDVAIDQVGRTEPVKAEVDLLVAGKPWKGSTTDNITAFLREARTQSFKNAEAHQNQTAKGGGEESAEALQISRDAVYAVAGQEEIGSNLVVEFEATYADFEGAPFSKRHVLTFTPKGKLTITLDQKSAAAPVPGPERAS